MLSLFSELLAKPPSPYINRFLSADTIVPGYANPQALNRYSYVLNDPVKLTDPTGHKCVGEAEECEDEDGNPINGAGGLIPTPHKGGNNKDKPFENMNPGDIITFEGEGVTYNYMLGQMDDGTLGFWDLDSHAYIPYALAVSMVETSNTWTTFKRTDPKTFNDYEVMSSSGAPAALPSFNVSWTGGMDDNPAYVEIRTQVDLENAPSHFLNTVLGPSLVTSFWGNAKPTVTPLSQAGYFPLTNYVIGLLYFANDGAAIARYPVIHP